MLRLLAAIIALSFCSAAMASNYDGQPDTYTRGHVKKDGTVVNPYRSTHPNDTKYDNYSTKGNTNPYTGVPGTKNPEPYPSPSPYDGSGHKKKGYGY